MTNKLVIRWAVVALVLSPFLIAGGIYLINHLILTKAMDEMTTAALNKLRDPEGGRVRNRKLTSVQMEVQEGRSMLQALQENGFRGILDHLIYDKGALDLCGEINGKNAFGAYGGYTHFNVSAIPDDKSEKIDFIVIIDSPGENQTKEDCSHRNKYVVFLER